MLAQRKRKWLLSTDLGCCPPAPWPSCTISVPGTATFLVLLPGCSGREEWREIVYCRPVPCLQHIKIRYINNEI